MDVVSISHRGLRDYFQRGDAKGLPPQMVPRIRTILFALAAAPDIATVEGPPGWRIHQLRGDRAGTWSISVTGNWRLTFRIDDGAIADLNLEDYH